MNFLAEANVTMAVPTADDRRITIQASGSGSPPVRDGPVPERVISVLFDTGLEEWRRGWNRSRGSVPAREVIVSASEPMRGATTTTQVVPNGRLAYTILGVCIQRGTAMLINQEPYQRYRGGQTYN